MPFSLRTMSRRDLPAVLAISQQHGVGEASQLAAFRRRIVALLGPRDRGVALVGVDEEGAVVGYLAGEVHLWEFGSAAAGWIFAVGVDRRHEGQGLGSALRAKAIERFARRHITTVRTMVRKDDVAVLRFFRSGGFHAGPYVELALDLGRPGQERP